MTRLPQNWLKANEEELANTLQCCLDSGAKKVLIPAISMMDFAAVPVDLMGAF